MRSPALTTSSDGFLLHGEPFRIISGAMHYFRIHPDLWADRLRKARLMGLNTVETYVPWNLHQPDPDSDLVLDGLLDLPRYLSLARAEGLHVLLRPGPYICAEWDGGGLPSWLTSDPDIRLRSSDPRFTDALDRYFDILLPPLLPYMAASGGPVIAVQVENEYGAYGDDSAYLKHVHQAFRSRGVEELLFTCDQAGSAHHLAAGSLPGVLSTATFGGRIDENLKALRAHMPEGPLMCSEFWIGWFDHWGEEHHVRDAESAAADLDKLLAAGASVNIYMFHGGTNFGFTNGANHDQCYAPIVTSYDYDAALTESGDPGQKYHAFREVIARHAPVPDEPVPAPAPRLSGITVELDRRAPLLPYATALDTSLARSEHPLSMEEFGQRSGYALYRTTLPEAGDGLLHFDGGVGDRAQVFVDGAPVGVLERERHDETLPLRVPRPGATLDVLVEHMGGVNYGPRIGAAKGLLGPVTFNGTALLGWDTHRLPLADLSTVPFAPAEATPVTVPAFHHGTFEVGTPADTFLSLPGWTKGQAWINGFHLGRYWNRGPQRTLYVPGPVLRAGVNDLVLLELNATTSARVEFTDTPDLGPVKPLMARPHRVRLRGPGEPQRRGRLPFADAPGVPDPIEVGSRLLTRGGRPWFPVSGEFHYSRYPAGEWEEELLKMKAGGVTVVAAYVIWIHHEETEGRVRFDGDRDLRRFAELCARHGLDFVPRIGPWVHAEVRGGGLPDWVLARTDAPRTDDPAYLAPVRRWYAAIAEQLRGLGRAEGGPIVAIQIENELYDQPDHLLTLKRMAQEAGLSAPLWTSTAWGGVRLPPDELLPLYGGYTDAFWTEADGGWPDTCRKHFFFTHQRDDEGIGADLRPTAAYGGDAEELSGRFPWATCELGGGMAVAYHRRPRVDAADVGALGLTKIGCGSVWQGYYMYHGGTNPPGDLTPLQESHATGYPNDLPRLTYDFQAPLGEYGQYRPSYDELRLQHLLLADFGGLIAPMESVLPELLPTGQDDRETLRWAVRADDRSGFLFVNNHQPHEPLPDRPGTSFEVEFPGDGPVLSLPSAPVTIPQGAYFCWPLRLEVAGLRLDWATAQPLCTVDDGRGRTILVLTATDGIAPELALDLRTVTTVSAPSDAEVTTTGDRALVTALRPGTDALVEVDTADGHRVGLLVLDAATARGAYRGPAWGAERLILSADGGVVFDAHADEVRIHSAADAPSLAVLPAPGRAPVVTGATVKETEDGVFVRYTLVAEDDDVRPGDGGGSGGVLPVTLARPAGEAPPVTTGAMGRASVPADGYFDAAAAEYGVALPADPPPGTLLRLHWTGDVARAYVGERLVADQFFSGRVWEIGLDRLPAGELRVRVLPLAAGAPVYVPGRVDDAAIPAELRRAECATVRSWPLRPG